MGPYFSNLWSLLLFVTSLSSGTCFIFVSNCRCTSSSSNHGLVTAIHRRRPSGLLMFGGVNKEEDTSDKTRRKLLLGLIVTTTTTALTTQVPMIANADENTFSLSGVGQLLSGNGSGNKKRIGGIANKIRNICTVMDELQRDLMQERWDLVEQYPGQLRSFVPLLTTYTDSAYPTDAPTDKGLRVALRYEVGRFFAALERLRQATSRKALNEAYVAYSDMALHFDRYLRVGGLYTYYDSTISTEPYFKGISDDALVFADPKKDRPDVRDLIVLVKGPDKGKTGIVIGVYPDGSQNCVVKLDRVKGMREIRIVQRSWVAKRLGEQDPDDVFLIPRKSG